MMRALRSYGALSAAALMLVGCATSQPQPPPHNHLGMPASAMVTLFANVSPGATEPLLAVGPDGNVTGPFALPPNTTLVITDLVASVNLVPAPGITRGGLINQSNTGTVNPYFSFDATDQGSQTITLTSGAVWKVTPRAVNAVDSANAVFLQAYGYLLPNP